MNLKLEINFYFLTKNYTGLKELIIYEEEAIKYFKKKQIEKLLAYAKQKKEIILATAILNELTTNNYQKFSDSEINNYLNEFLSLAYTNPIMLYNLSNILSNNTLKYADIIAKIKDFNLKSDITEITLYILYLDGFYDERLVNKIINTKDTHYIFELIKETNQQNTKNILQKYLKLNPIPLDIYYLSQELAGHNDKLEILINIILNLNIKNSIKSKYLLSTYKSINSISLKNKLITSILNLNSLLSIFDLMQLLSSEDQEKIANKYIEERNEETIFILACTTKCSKTKDLIDYIFPNLDFYNLTILLSYVNEKYVDYILKRILNEKKEEYLRILNELYLIGSNRFILMINFIIANKLESLFDLKIVQKLIAKKDRERKRNLT